MFFQYLLPVLTAIGLLRGSTTQLDHTWFEWLGLPLYFSLPDSWQWVSEWCEYLGLKTLMGVPDADRFQDLIDDCTQLEVTISSWKLAKSLGSFSPVGFSNRYYVCKVLIGRGYVTEQSAPLLLRLMALPWLVIDWILSLGPIALIILTTCTIISVCALALYVCYILARRSNIQVACDPPPFTHREVKDILCSYFAKNKLDVDSVDPDPTGHPKLAYIRRQMEKAMQVFLLRLNRKIRDVGGSLSRSAKLLKQGSKHICFPNLTSADKERLELAKRNLDAEAWEHIGLHKGDECPHRSLPSYMTYVDFHLSPEQLCRTIKSPTLILTHDFAKVDKDGEQWFNGECDIKRYGDFISFQTRGGLKYTHGYHAWENEGTICTTEGTLRYYRVYEAHGSIIIYACPVAGEYTPRVDNTLCSTAGSADAYKLNNGVEAHVKGDVVQVGDHEISKDTLYRVAYQMSLLPRDEKWLPNCSSVLRGRFTADEMPASALHDSLQFVVMLADRMAVSYRQSMIGDPQSYNFLMRRVLLLVLNLTSRLPDTLSAPIVAAFRSFRRFLSGKSPRHALSSWMWTVHRVPTYEVMWDNVAAMLIDPKKPNSAKQPFPFSGATAVAPTVEQPSGDTSQDEGKPACRDRKESSSSCSPPSPGSSGVGKSQAILQPAGLPDDPANLPATTSANTQALPQGGVGAGKKKAETISRTICIHAVHGGRNHGDDCRGYGLQYLGKEGSALRRDRNRGASVPIGDRRNSGTPPPPSRKRADRSQHTGSTISGEQTKSMVDSSGANSLPDVGQKILPVKTNAARGGKGVGGATRPVGKGFHNGSVRQGGDVSHRNGSSQYKPARS
ncbi:hypothetical protein 1 [Wenling tombus-like virus 4]|uniref:hypothetical protein 1 n=1 Tax=Wenling tombus-like virus 4 TaxID=1923546 RepID=UPI000909D4B1|nr:hypothetical protein 1 [Wenling tombus-like virus 4]APG76578.1 hypothetical protein 1 [Wenling tombus-like virus 4]